MKTVDELTNIFLNNELSVMEISKEFWEQYKFDIEFLPIYNTNLKGILISSIHSGDGNLFTLYLTEKGNLKGFKIDKDYYIQEENDSNFINSFDISFMLTHLKCSIKNFAKIEQLNEVHEKVLEKVNVN